MDTHSAPVDCPFCGSTDTGFSALFGQQLLTVQYYCNACRTPFERVKGNDIMLDAWAHVHKDTGSGESDQ
jgi:hypothetical protein